MSAPSRKQEMAEKAIAQEYRQWCQKKRPATPAFRAELLRSARDNRDYSTFARKDGLPLTPEDRRHIRLVNLQGHREYRAVLLRADEEAEVRFWQRLAKYGIRPEGGVQ